MSTSIELFFVSGNILSIQWVGYATYLTPSIVKKMSTAKYEILFTTNAKDTIKAYSLELLYEWIIKKPNIVSDHGEAFSEARVMKIMLKKDKPRLVIMYQTGDCEQLDTTNNLNEYRNHFHDIFNCYGSLKTFSQDWKFVVVYKDTLTLFPIHGNISGRNWSQIKDNAPAPTGPNPFLGLKKKKRLHEEVSY